MKALSGEPPRRPLRRAGFWVAFTRPRSFLPQEHGSWALFLMPLLVGALLARAPGPRLGVYALAALVLFAIRQPLDLLLRSLSGKRARADMAALLAWIALFGVVAVACLYYLLLVLHLWGLLLIGGLGAALVALQLWASSARLTRTSWSEVLGTAGLGLVATGAYYTGTGRLWPVGFVLWALTALEGIGGVLYSRWRLRRRRLAARGKPPDGGARVAVLAHYVLAVVVALGLAALRLAPWAVVPLYALLLLRVVVGARPAAMPDRSVIRIGISEGLVTLAAGAWIVLAFVL